MGTYWNQGSYVLIMDTLYPCPPPTMPHSPLRFRKLVEVTDQLQPIKNVLESNNGSQRATISNVPRIRIGTADEFEKVLRAEKLVVLEGCDLGTCVHRWNSAYITENVGPQRKVSSSKNFTCYLHLTNELWQVVVHEASSSSMDFNSKNFRYTTKDFASFMAEAKKGGRQYLRALSEEHPADQPANVKADFPGLASDFQLPPELYFVKQNEFSSVLRISGRVNMWLHYDGNTPLQE